MYIIDVAVETKPVGSKEALVSDLIAELTRLLGPGGRTQNAVELKLANIDSVIARLQPHLRAHLTRLIEKRDGSHYQWSLSVAVRSGLHQRGFLLDPDIAAEPAPRRRFRNGDWTEEENRVIVKRYLELQGELTSLH
jgi:hypothetical protein